MHHLQTSVQTPLNLLYSHTTVAPRIQTHPCAARNSTRPLRTHMAYAQLCLCPELGASRFLPVCLRHTTMRLQAWQPDKHHHHRHQHTPSKTCSMLDHAPGVHIVTSATLVHPRGLPHSVRHTSQLQVAYAAHSSVTRPSPTHPGFNRGRGNARGAHYAHEDLPAPSHIPHDRYNPCCPCGRPRTAAWLCKAS